MKHLSTTFLAAAAAVLTGVTALAQSQTLVGVVVHPAVALDVIMVAEGHAGTRLATTDRSGRGSFDIAALANSSKFGVYEEKCADATRVLLVADGSAAPSTNDCRRRRLGAYDPLKDGALTVKLASGLSTVTKSTLAAGAGAGALVVKSLLGGHEEPRQDERRDEVPRFEVATNDGRFGIVANRATDTCGSFVPSFNGEVEVRSNGGTTVVTMKERMVRTYTGTIQSNGTFSGTGGGAIGAHSYQGLMQGQVVNNTITGQETLNFVGGPCADRQASYRFTGNKLP
jgi:hypothetical protein